MDTTGKLADNPLPSMLHQLFVSNATGVVKLETRLGAHAMYLRDGYPVTVILPGSAELLGKVLLEMGILDEANYRQSLAQPPPQGKRYGEVLVEKGLVTGDQIRLALKAQVRRKLHRLFFLNEGSWAFMAGTHTQGMQGQESLRVHPYRAIYHGVRSAWPADRLVDALFLLQGKAIKLKLTGEEAARYGLGPDDGRAAELLRKGFWTVSDLVDGAGLPPQPVHALVYSFYITESLDIQAADAVPRLKRKTTGEHTAPAPPSEASGAWKIPSGTFTAPQPTTPKSILKPGSSVSVPSLGNTPPSGTRAPSGTSFPQLGRSPSGSGYPQLPGGGIDVEAVRKQIELKAKVVDTENLFQVLGLPPSAGRDDIKTAYFEAAKRFHPDRLHSMGLESMRPEVEKIFRRVSEAYSMLYDDGQREVYKQGMSTPKSAGDSEAHAKAMKMLEAEMAFRRGEILMRKNDYNGALVELEAAMQANPTEGEHLAYLTWVKLCLGQLTHAAARPLFQESVKLTPNCARAHYFLGLTLKEENDIDKAYAAFRKAQEIDPRMLDAEREMRLINMRKEKAKKESGLFSKLLNKK